MVGFCGGSCYDVDILGITPLQSAMLTTSFVPIATSTPMTAFSSFIPIEDQPWAVGKQDFVYKVYGSLWLNQTLPPFTNETLALAPFTLEAENRSLINTTWSALTESYTMDLVCETPILSYDTGRFEFFDRDNCSVTPSLEAGRSPEDPGHFLQYLGWARSKWNTDALVEHVADGTSTECMDKFRHTYLAVSCNVQPSSHPEYISKNLGPITALFCRPQYYAQNVTATVSSSNFSIISVEPQEPRRPLSTNVFDSTYLEDFLNNAEEVRDAWIPLNGGVPRYQDITASLTILAWSEASSMNISLANSLMPPYAVKASGVRAQDFQDSKVMQQSFEKIHRLLVVTAVNQLLRSTRQSKSMASTVFGQSTSQVQAIILIRKFAVAINVLLSVMVLSSLSLIYFYWNRPCKLEQDPTTIRNLMRMLPLETSSLQHLRDLDRLNTSELKRDLIGRRFTLDRQGSTLDPATNSRLTELHRYTNHFSINLELKSPSQMRPIMPKTILPKELSAWAGIAFCLILIASFVSFLVLRSRVQALTGIISKPTITNINLLIILNTELPLPSTNLLTQQAILNYIPTAFATLLEPFWTLLSRWLCILLPYDILRRGQAKASQSIDIGFTSIPPAFNIWTGLQARQYFPSGVCGITLASNLLAIAFSSLFQTESVIFNELGRFQPQF